jgi:CelD/BcsL family acetyltransferase involved in cellulose biosynthesis
MNAHGFSARITIPGELYSNEIEAWEKLCAAVPTLSSPFFSHHYARAVSESGIDVRVCVIYKEGVVCGFLPYQFRNRLSNLAKAAEPVGGEMTDQFGLIAEPDLRITSAQLLRLAQVNYLGFSHLDRFQLGYGLTGEQPRVGLRVRLAQDTEDPLKALLADRNRYLRDSERCSRRLLNEWGPVALEFDTWHDRKEVLNDLIKQKRLQYQRTNVPDALGSAWKTDLLHKLSDYRFSSCRGVLSTMSVGGQRIAAHFGIMGNGVFQYWLPVYNPDFAKYAPGRLLIHHIIESSCAERIHTIDQGEGDTASKRELANEEQQLFRGVWHNNSVASSVVRGFQSIKWRLSA